MGNAVYYPYFRGKQYELIAIRENAHRMNQIVPIIETVKQSISGLRRTLEALIENKVQFILIANPRCGDLCSNFIPILEDLISSILGVYDKWSLGCIIDEHSTSQEIENITGYHSDLSIIHAGNAHASTIADTLARIDWISTHIFVEDACSRIYRRRFRDKERILIRDGFTQRINREHPDIEHFSDLHITYTEEGMDGFGDFLIVGNDYSDVGGPAYAVAIHLTFIDENEDKDMFVKHYISDRSSTPTDPAGKFAEALAKLVEDVTTDGSPIYRSDAVDEYMQLHDRGHYPGLGYVKKLSMQHHIELMVNFLE